MRKLYFVILLPCYIFFTASCGNSFGVLFMEETIKKDENDCLVCYEAEKNITVETIENLSKFESEFVSLRKKCPCLYSIHLSCLKDCSFVCPICKASFDIRPSEYSKAPKSVDFYKKFIISIYKKVPEHVKIILLGALSYEMLFILGVTFCFDIPSPRVLIMRDLLSLFTSFSIPPYIQKILRYFGFNDINFGILTYPELLTEMKSTYNQELVKHLIEHSENFYNFKKAD